MLEWLRKSLTSQAQDAHRTLPVERYVAAAALLVEAATLDAGYSGEERAAIRLLLQRHFKLTADEARALVEEAETRHGRASDLHRFTQSVKQGFSPEERVAIIEMLWEIAYCDGVLHHYEANLLRRVAGLIYVTDRETGDARKRVMARLHLAD